MYGDTRLNLQHLHQRQILPIRTKDKPVIKHFCKIETKDLHFCNSVKRYVAAPKVDDTGLELVNNILQPAKKYRV
jgi:hypothetical protein